MTPDPAALPAYRPPVEIFDEVILKRRRMAAEGLDVANDDARAPEEWADLLGSLHLLLARGLAAGDAHDVIRRRWVRITALAFAALEAEDRKIHAKLRAGEG